jgi:hypothetical protein
MAVQGFRPGGVITGIPSRDCAAGWASHAGFPTQPLFRKTKHMGPHGNFPVLLSNFNQEWNRLKTAETLTGVKPYGNPLKRSKVVTRGGTHGEAKWCVSAT